MKGYFLLLLAPCFVAMYSCGVVHDAPRNAFADGLYTGTVLLLNLLLP